MLPPTLGDHKGNHLVIKNGQNCPLTSNSFLSPGLQHAEFRSKYGPNFFPTFEVFLTTTPNRVTLSVQDQEKTEVWKRTVHLPGKSISHLKWHTTRCPMNIYSHVFLCIDLCLIMETINTGVSQIKFNQSVIRQWGWVRFIVKTQCGMKCIFLSCLQQPSLHLLRSKKGNSSIPCPTR